MALGSCNLFVVSTTKDKNDNAFPVLNIRQFLDVGFEIYGLCSVHNSACRKATLHKIHQLDIN